MEKHLNKWSKKELLQLPCRNWNDESVYDSVLVLSTGKKHDSKWGCMAIIGIVNGKPIEIASSCSDDIEWKVTEMKKCAYWLIGQIRQDCAFKSGAMHFWSRENKFKVGCALSSITIELV